MHIPPPRSSQHPSSTVNVEHWQALYDEAQAVVTEQQAMLETFWSCVQRLGEENEMLRRDVLALADMERQAQEIETATHRLGELEECVRQNKRLDALIKEVCSVLQLLSFR